MKLGPYETTEKLGEGGMGMVLRARDPRDPGAGEVAVKLLRRPEANQARERFAREERLQELLSAEEGFVPLLASGESAEGPWFAMPLLAGGTLRARLAGGAMKVPDAVALVAALSAIMARAHAKGVVHRDLKPENVLFDTTGDGARPLIADLGLAKHFLHDVPGASASLSLSKAGSLRGTPGYMAPEQIVDARSCGPPADVFALGAILYECLTGEAPFRGDTLIELVAALRSEERPRLDAKAAPPWLSAIVDRCLALEPAARFADGAALAEALHAGEGRAGTTARRAVAIALATAAVAGSLWFWARGSVEPPGPDLAKGERATRIAREVLARVETKGPARAEAEEALLLDPTNALAWCAHGKAWRLTGKFDKAVEDFNRAIQLDPTLAAAFAHRGSARMGLKQFPEALADAKRSVELDPAYAWGWRTLAHAQLYSKDEDAALAAAERAVALDPNLAQAWTCRAIVRCQRNEWVPAERDATRAIELDPLDHYAWSNRAAARYEQHNDDGAQSDVTRAIEIAAWSAGYWTQRAYYRTVKGDLDGALSDYREAIARDPSAVNHRWRAYVRKRAKDLDGAIADFTSAVAIAPAVALYRYDLAEACFDKGLYADAVQHDTKAIELDPKHGIYWSRRGVHRMFIGESKQAIGDFGEAIALDPKQAVYWANRAVAKDYTDDFEGALADANRSIELDPAPAHAYIWRGWARVELGELETGIADLERALRMEPTRKEAWRSLGRARLKLSQLDAAVQAFTKRVELTPQDAVAYFDRANAYATRGDAKEAIADLDRALGLGLAEPDAAKARRLRGELSAPVK